AAAQADHPAAGGPAEDEQQTAQRQQDEERGAESCRQPGVDEEPGDGEAQDGEEVLLRRDVEAVDDDEDQAELEADEREGAEPVGERDRRGWARRARGGGGQGEPGLILPGRPPSGSAAAPPPGARRWPAPPSPAPPPPSP